MTGAFYIGATGLDAQQRALDVVANNITNINTLGFKRSSAQFSALVGNPSSTSAQTPDASAAQALYGVTVDTSAIDFTQGQLTQTGQAMDVAVSGAGFIELMGPSGQTLLWRGGTMQVNADGYLAAPNGMPLKGMVSVPQGVTNLAIGADGSVVATIANAATKVIGQIDLVQDKDPSTLSAVSGGFYAPESPQDLTSGAPGANGAGLLVQGSVEASNVNLANEMVNLLVLQRAYSASAQVVQAGDQLMSIANNLRR